MSTDFLRCVEDNLKIIQKQRLSSKKNEDNSYGRVEHESFAA